MKIGMRPELTAGNLGALARRAALCALLATGSSCDGPAETGERIPTYPVHGRLLIDGVPAPGAMLKFYSGPGKGRVPTAIAREDGSFSASYYGVEDGSPAGEYRVLVVWMQTPAEGGLAQDRLQGQFLDPRAPAATVTIEPTENRLAPIELRTRGVPSINLKQ